jgi:hypothetical protein
VKGRRRPDVPFGTLPIDPQPGDYWKYLDRTTGLPAEPGEVEGADGNLTQTVWGYFSPDGGGIGTLMIHTVRENDDGTITVAPGDGSSNSILHRSGKGKQWHGYIDKGVWKPV